ncbi:hypothetical protein NBT05_17715 [Aquimarina sp. ERC-38]|uniref:hypothetical protein n=1 Tax=Aquimarina sp. ERC-38 TaxID=2949996 RepID=UPI0022472782|nr:hypothetical protein [Aquimarina sp. ERC-38]UZO80762.1 hypothetical protein NBT05_17715 [Aquimarina sp. ERC-38]
MRWFKPGNRTMIILTATLCFGFIITGLTTLLDYLLVQILWVGLFFYFIISLVFVNLPEEKDE